MNSKAIRKQLLAAVAMVLVAAVALGSSTYAWFVNNNKVKSELNNISAASASASLYIEYGKHITVPIGKKTTDTATSSKTLVPVSNNYANGALGDWYIVNGWENASASTYANLSSATDAVEAYGYQLEKSGDTLTGASIKVTASAEESARVGAYSVGEYTLYTVTGKQDIYLDPTNPITVEEGNLTGGTAHLKDAIRIAVVATSGSDTKTLYYLPTAETKAGNDKDSAATGTGSTTVYGVNSSTSIAEITAGTDSSEKGYFTPDTLKYWAAADNGNGVYKVGTDTKYKLGTAGYTAADLMNVKVYVWLEGTDGECLINEGVDGVSGLNVSLNFVGIDAA